TLVSSLTSTKSAERLPSRAMAETRARGLLETGALAGGGALLMPVTGLGGGGGAGRDCGGFVAVAGAAALGAAGGTVGCLGGTLVGGTMDFPPPLAGGATGAGVVCTGAAVAPSGVPQRAQNLKV